jgi:3-deoxy-D-manno-octulosonate 8-phosphate phosphatase KdsC-like HAD superfamily phosphatase
MKMEFIHMKQPVKMLAYEEIREKAGVSDSAVAYIGDDLPDIPLMGRAGLDFATLKWPHFDHYIWPHPNR